MTVPEYRFGKDMLMSTDDPVVRTVPAPVRDDVTPTPIPAPARRSLRSVVRATVRRAARRGTH